MQLARHLKIGVGAAGAFFFGLLFGWILFPTLIKNQLKKEMSLSKKTDVRAMWTKVPFPIDFKIYLFNYTNPEEIQKGARPIVQEIGPYYFEEWKEKVDLQDHEENDTITFKKIDTFYFKKELSGPGLTGEEMIIVPNLLILETEDAAAKKPEIATFLERSYEIFFDNPSDIFLRAKVMDVLFRGIIVDCSANVFATKLICDFFKRKEMEKKITNLPNNLLKLSIFGARNGTVDPRVFTVMRGIKNVKDVGRVVAVDGKLRQGIWRGECDEFAGTDGTVFPPFFSHKDRVVAYSPDFCRSFKAWYEKRTSYRGIKTNRYVLDFGDLANDPELQCFCDSPDQCPEKGLMDLKKCVNSRIYSSLPHFLGSPKFLLQNVEGLKPDINLHGMEIDFEPLTGTPLRVVQRVQFNTPIERRADTKLFAHIPNVMLPLFWVEEGFSLNKTYTNMLKYQLFLPKLVVRVVSWLLVLGGAFGMIATTLYHFKDKIMNYMRASRTNQVNRIKPQEQTIKKISVIGSQQPTKISG